MDPSEPDGITSAPTPKPLQGPNSGPPGAVTRGRLQSLEQNLLVLERNYGATHPQVYKSPPPPTITHQVACLICTRCLLKSASAWRVETACANPSVQNNNP